jgi:Na+/proline symporter
MIYLVCIIAYLLILAGISIVKSKEVKNQDDFAVAGRSLSPWVMVCTMLAVWIGTGSIVGNAEQTYERGMAVLLLPVGTFLGLILLSLVASKARNIKACSVPEIIEQRFGQGARMLSMIALVIAYMVIVSYQFNAGGAVLEVIRGNKAPVPVQVGDEVTQEQLTKGRLVYQPDKSFEGDTQLSVIAVGNSDRTRPVIFPVHVNKTGSDISPSNEIMREAQPTPVELWVKKGSFKPLRLNQDMLVGDLFTVQQVPTSGTLNLVEPALTARSATIIAACFIIGYTAFAGLMSLAYMDILTGTIIMLAMCIGLPLYMYQAGGWDGMLARFIEMGKPEHMQLWGVYSPIELANFVLPVFLLVSGDANQYQRIFASRNAKGAKKAVTALIFTAFAIELLIIACAWAASSMTPDPENGKYILIYAARHYLTFMPMSCLFMVTVVAIIVSTANSFLHVPATTVINDLYLPFINPKASQKRIVFLSRALVVVFGIIAFLVSLVFSESTGFFRKAMFAFTIYGAAITPSLVAAIVWKGATKAGAVSSILVGTVVSIGWQVYLKDYLPAPVKELDAVLPALVMSVACLVIISLLTSKKRIDTSSA